MMKFRDRKLKVEVILIKDKLRVEVEMRELNLRESKLWWVEVQLEEQEQVEIEIEFHRYCNLQPQSFLNLVNLNCWNSETSLDWRDCRSESCWCLKLMQVNSK